MKNLYISIFVYVQGIGIQSRLIDFLNSSHNQGLPIYTVTMKSFR